MSEMRERLASILFHHDDGEATGITIGEARELAGQLLTAMRDPTAAMLQAWDVHNIQGPQTNKWKLIVWRAMIDAALTD